MLGREADGAVFTDSTQRFSRNHYKAESLVAPSYVSAEGEPSEALLNLPNEFVQPLLKKTNYYQKNIGHKKQSIWKIHN